VRTTAADPRQFACPPLVLKKHIESVRIVHELTVAVVQSADEGARYDGSHFGRVHRSWLRCVLPQRKMRSPSVIADTENSIQRFPGFPSNVTLLLPGRLLNPGSSSIPHVVDFNSIHRGWDLRDAQTAALVVGLVGLQMSVTDAARTARANREYGAESLDRESVRQRQSYQLRMAYEPGPDACAEEQEEIRKQNCQLYREGRKDRAPKWQPDPLFGDFDKRLQERLKSMP